MARKWAPTDPDDLVRRYLGGESEKALAEAFDVSRNVIRRVLLSLDVEPRGRHEGMVVRMSRTPREERLRLTEAAHAAMRGRKAPIEELEARALHIERHPINVSKAEVVLAEMLAELGREVIPQKAVGKYNVDLATGSVAVEVLGGAWHRAKSHGQRLRYLLDRGWDVLYIWVDGIHYPLSRRAADDVVAFAQARDRDPAMRRRYRVIRGGGEFVAQGSLDDDQIPDKVPLSSRPETPPDNVPFGYCRCGCGGKTSIARLNRRGHRIGEPVSYISGHNYSRRPG